MAIPTLNIPINDDYIIQGDTIHAIQFAFDALDDIDLTGATIKMQVYRRGEAIIDVSTGNGITLVDDKTFIIDEIEKENNDLPIGTFQGDIEITLANGFRKTYLRVKYTIDKEYTV